MKLTLAKVKNNRKIQSFIRQTEKYMDALGFTDHGYRHLKITTDRAKYLAQSVGLPLKEQELAMIAGYAHDMGNFLGRTQHHYWSAMLFSQVFMADVDDADDLSVIIQAIVSHDKDDLKIVDAVTAIVILADKSDVHRDRVKNKDLAKIKEDIHDRVNYSVTENSLTVEPQKRAIVLKLKLDIKVIDPLEYFEIFTARMTFCRQAAEFLGYDFVLTINDFKLS